MSSKHQNEVAIMQLCTIAGQPARAVAFIAAGADQGDVLRQLRAEQAPDPYAGYAQSYAQARASARHRPVEHALPGDGQAKALASMQRILRGNGFEPVASRGRS